MRVCELTGKRRNAGNNVSHAHNKTKMVQQPNIQKKRIFLPEEGRYIKLSIATSAIRSINKMGLRAFCKRLGVDYQKLVAKRLV